MHYCCSTIDTEILSDFYGGTEKPKSEPKDSLSRWNGVETNGKQIRRLLLSYITFWFTFNLRFNNSHFHHVLQVQKKASQLELLFQSYVYLCLVLWIRPKEIEMKMKIKTNQITKQHNRNDPKNTDKTNTKRISLRNI